MVARDAADDKGIETMTTYDRYILIERTDDEGGPLDPECYPVNTVAELDEAADALRDAGVAEERAWVGEGEDAIETSLVIRASMGNGACTR